MTCLVVSSCPLHAQLMAGLLSQCCGFPIQSCCGGVEEVIAALERDRPERLILDGDGDEAGCERIARHLLALNDRARLILLSVKPRLDPLRRELATALMRVDSWGGLIAAVRTVEPVAVDARLPDRMPDASRFATLRPRERTVLELLGAGLVSREIAQFLGLSLQTVETYRKSLSAKLGVSGARLVRIAVLYTCLHLGHLSAPAALASDGSGISPFSSPAAGCLDAPLGSLPPSSTDAAATPPHRAWVA